MKNLILFTLFAVASADVYTASSSDPLPDGEWTAVIDYGTAMGSGEYETVWTTNYYGDCDIPCETPIAVEVNTTSGIISDMMYCRPNMIQVLYDDGFQCDNVYSSSSSESNPDGCLGKEGKCAKNGLGKDCRGCPEVAVRFYCSQADIDNYSCSDNANKRRSFKHVMMREFGNFMAHQEEAHEKRWQARQLALQKKQHKKVAKESIDTLLATLLKKLH